MNSGKTIFAQLMDFVPAYEGHNQRRKRGQIFPTFLGLPGLHNK
ncbi:MAG: hypothetical protein NTY86_07635 [Deltaproteobacteria bacterium]|jgi:hypothetical protein|nr:hypothetical protein [Deltaproteobacteria bacterium]